VSFWNFALTLTKGHLSVFATMPLSIEDRLRRVGLRPTRQRRDLAHLIFRQGDRHFTAEGLHFEAVEASMPVSLATVYNNLHQFTQAGLLRPLSMDGTKTFFDTNVSNHHHFLVEGDNTVIDIPEGGLSVGGLPVAPDGYEISHVDVIVRLRRKTV
jgi:Fur family transcriptional regulator, iron response regulator